MLLRSADCHCQRRAQAVGRGAPDTRSAPTFGAYFTQAINGCSVNRQLSMTPCPRLTVAFLYWRRAWVDCHSPLNNTGLPAKTEDEQRAVTSAKSAPIAQSTGASDTPRGGLSQSPNPVQNAQSQPQKIKVCAVVARLSMNWRAGSRLSRPRSRLDNIFLLLISLITVKTDARIRPPANWAVRNGGPCGRRYWSL